MYFRGLQSTYLSSVGLVVILVGLSGCGVQDESDVLDSSLETLADDKSSSSAAVGTTKLIEIDVGEEIRSFYIYLPTAYLASTDPNRKWPLAVALHSQNEFDGAGFIRDTLFTEEAEANGYLAAFPNQHSIDDHVEEILAIGMQAVLDKNQAFLEAVLDYSIERGADPSKTYLLGYGSGSVWAQSMACRLSARFAAFAFVSGTIATTLLDDCAPERFPSILMIHGTDDTSIPYSGMKNWYGLSFNLASFSETEAHWAGLGNCGTTPELTLIPDNDPEDGTISSRTVRTDCTNGQNVESIVVQNGSHTYPGGVFPTTFSVSQDFNANAVALEFFTNHPATP